MRKLLMVAAMSSAAAMASPAVAADSLWLDSDHTSYSNNQTTNGVFSFTSSGGVNVNVSGWSVNNSGFINSATLGIWTPGLGVINGPGDNAHTIDNSGFLDFILLQFDQVVELDRAWFSASSSWGPYDTDATIGYGLSAVPFGTTPGLGGATLGSLGSFGLSLFENTGPSGSNNRDINPGGKTGNLWLIGTSFNNGRHSSLDGFKLEKLKFDVVPPPPPAVPEPGTWLMMILGFGLVGGVLRSQRRQKLTVSYS